jgi:hypothetical protein
LLRIATVYESRLGRNDGNPLYVTACLKRMQYYGAILSKGIEDKGLLSWFTGKGLDPRAKLAAEKLWNDHKEFIEVDHIYPTGDISPFGTYDLFVHTDWGEDGLTGILPYKPFETPHPFASWASDTHLGYDYRLSLAKKADFAFCAQKRAVEEFKRDGVQNSLWLPHAVEPLAYPKGDLVTKHHEVCFVGHVNSANRVEALDRLFSEFPNFHYGQALFEGAAQRFADSKVCFNISMLDDLNMRTFEIMATGSFCLTNWIPTIEDLFEDGKHLVLYRSLDEMVDKAKYYLSHDEEREKIAQAGYEEVIKKHTIQDRVNVILDEYIKARQPKELAHASI